MRRCLEEDGRSDGRSVGVFYTLRVWGLGRFGVGDASILSRRVRRQGDVYVEGRGS